MNYPSKYNIELINLFNNKSIVKEALGIALQDVPVQILELENACKEKHPKKINAAAHIIKGSSSSMRFGLMAKIAEKIESESTENWNDILDSHLSELNSEWEIVKKIIQQKIN